MNENWDKIIISEKMSETRKTPRSPDAPLPGLERPSKRRKIMALKPRKLTTTSNGGHFDEISLEVLYLILDKLSLKDVSIREKKGRIFIFTMIILTFYIILNFIFQ